VSGAQPAPMGVPVSREPYRLGWRGAGWFACGVARRLAIAWFIIFSRVEIGSKAEWFFGAVVLCVVMVTMWQTLNVQRQANQHATEAAERLRTQLVAAEEYAARELAMTQALHRVEMEAREKAMNPVFEQISRIVNDCSVEVTNANILIEDGRVHRALNQVNEAAVMAIRVAEDVHDAVVDGRTPKPDPIRTVQRLMQTRAAEARRLAWQLLRHGLEDTRAATE
jgi:hypothetical protein